MVMERVRLTFDPGVTSATVCEVVHSLALPLDGTSQNLARYALIELLTNALRASVEKGVSDPVVAEIRCDEEKVRVNVEDRAAGFDVRGLPYHFDQEPERVDIMSREFERYRETHGYTQFGLGLLMVRRCVDDFRMAFLNGKGEPTPWTGVGSVRGTRVEFSLSRVDEGGS